MTPRFDLALIFLSAVLLIFERIWFPAVSYAAAIGIMIAIDLALFFATHVALSFISYIGLPEVRQGLRGFRSPIPIATASLVVAFVVLFSFFLGLGLLCATRYGIAFVFLYQILLTAAFFHHDIMQKFGVWSMHGHDEGVGFLPEDRRWFHVFLILVLLDQLAAGFPFFFSTSVSQEWLRLLPQLVQDSLGILKIALAAGVFLVACRLIFSPSRTRRKSVFAGRLFVYAAMPFSFAAVLMVRMLHGFEYFAINYRMFENSRFQWRKLKFILPAAGFLVAVPAFAILSYVPFAQRDLVRPPSEWLLVALSINFALIFIHYGLDRLIFRMRDESIRRNVGRLLLAGDAASGSN